MIYSSFFFYLSVKSIAGEEEMNTTPPLLLAKVEALRAQKIGQKKLSTNKWKVI